MIHIAQQYVIQFVNHQNVIHHALSQRMLYVMLNVKNQNVKLNAQIKDVKCLIAQNVLQYVNNHIVLLTAKLQNLNVKQYARNQDVTGNATNHLAQNQNANSYVKIQTVYQKLNAVHALVL
jgi:hypothetical protein